jgi:hypothetical protein
MLSQKSDFPSIGRACGHCGGPIERGTGYHNAVLCIACWAELLVRLEHGESQTSLADEYGVSQPTIHIKRLKFGGENEATG